MEVLKRGRARVINLDIPFDKDESSCRTTGRKKKVLRFYTTNIPGVSDFYQNLCLL